MTKRKEDEYNKPAKRLKYTSGVEHWKCDCPYCRRVVHVWHVNEDHEPIIEDDCCHWRGLNRVRLTMHFVRVTKTQRRKFDRMLREKNGNFKAEPTLFDAGNDHD
jgi:hypothetical protein